MAAQPRAAAAAAAAAATAAPGALAAGAATANSPFISSPLPPQASVEQVLPDVADTPRASFPGSPSSSGSTPRSSSPRDSAAACSTGSRPTAADIEMNLAIDKIIHDNAKELTDMLAAGLNIHLVFGKARRNLAHVAASFGAAGCLGALLKKGVEVNCPDHVGITPLHLAARNGHKKCVRVLVEDYHANIAATDGDGSTVLHCLAGNGRTELLDYVLGLTRGHGLHVEDRQRQTPLHSACRSGHSLSAQLLLQRGADVSHADESGATPLVLACRFGHSMCVRALISHSPTILDNCADALSACFVSNSGECIAALLQAQPGLCARFVVLCIKQPAATASRMLIATASAVPAQAAPLLTLFAEQLCTAGLQLSSLSSPVEEAQQHLLACTTLFSALARHMLKSRPGHPRHDEKRRGSPVVAHDVSAMLETSLAVVEPMWGVLYSWFDLLLQEPGVVELGTSLQPAPQRPAAVPPAAVPPAAAAAATAAAAGQTGTNTSLSTNHTLPWPAAAAAMPLPVQVAAAAPALLPPLPPKVPSSITLPATSSINTTPAGREENKAPSGPSSSTMLALYRDRLCAMVHSFHLLSTAISSLARRFGHFVRHYRPVVRAFVATCPALVFQHFLFIIDDPLLFREFATAIHSQPFELRRQWLYTNLPAATADPEELAAMAASISISRENIFESSCEALANLNDAALLAPLTVTFRGEEAVGAGVRKEWFSILTKTMLNPDYGLFVPVQGGAAVHPSSLSDVNPDHLQYFCLAGKLVGLAIMYQQALDIRFTPAFYKQLLSVPLDPSDIRAIDEELATGLTWLLEHPLEESGLDLTFTTDADVFGRMMQVELLPGGAKVPVTEENKQGYVQLLMEVKMARSVRPQLVSFLEGLHMLVPRKLLNLFNETELELLITGAPLIDARDWQTETHYIGYEPTDPIIGWFWIVVNEFTEGERAALLQFATGTARAPLGGFANLNGPAGRQRFTISRWDTDCSHLPNASTCFNMLRLPPYTSLEETRTRLRALSDCGASEGFAFA